MGFEDFTWEAALIYPVNSLEAPKSQCVIYIVFDIEKCSGNNENESFKCFVFVLATLSYGLFYFHDSEHAKHKVKNILEYEI